MSSNVKVNIIERNIRQIGFRVIQSDKANVHNNIIIHIAKPGYRIHPASFACEHIIFTQI